MKLKNKRSGEIKEFVLFDDRNELQGGVTLKDLVEVWEDVAEEPKEYYWIDYDGKVKSFIDLYEWQDKMKEIGNYFATKEEAEKAVERLRAWKSLKDKGFRFCGWATNEGIRGVDFEVPDSFFSEHNHSCISDETRADLDLLFGGEE